MRAYEHVIVGNSAAGIGAAEALAQSRQARRGGICIISEEEGPAYARPFIGHLVDGSRSTEELWYRPKDFYAQHGIELMGGQKAAKLDLPRRRVIMEGGERVAFRTLLLSTGGSPIMPPIPGLAENASTFSCLEDARKIRDGIDRGEFRSAVVLGGGLIGVAAASSLVERGVAVTLVELAPRILSTVLDEEASSMVQEMIDQYGVRTILGHTISRVARNDAIFAGIDTGESIEADLLIAAIGVRPRLELAKDAGIEIDRGIVVNRRMETSHPGVFAAGDCAQVYDAVRERNMVLALWPTAYAGGRVAGRNMMGDRAELDWTTSMNSMNYFGMPVLSAGLVTSPEGNGWETIARRDGSSYRKVLLCEGIPKGFVLVGDVDRAGVLLQMMRKGIAVSKLKESPLSAGFGIAHMPTRERRRLWREATEVA